MLSKHLPLFFFSKVFSSLLCSVSLSVPVVYVAVSQQPSLPAPPCSPSGLSLGSLIPPVVYVAVSQQPSLLASPCSPLSLSLSSLFPPVVHVAVSQQPSLLASPCSPLLARPQACPLVLSFLLLCMLLYYSNPLVARVMASAFSRCLSSSKKNFVV